MSKWGSKSSFEKFIMLGDVHLRSNNPASRVDSFFDTQMEKMKEVISLANESQASILCTGDVFDRPDSSHSLLAKYLPVFRQLEGRFLVVPGNHDIYGANLGTLDRSALGVFASSGVLDILSHDPIIVGNVGIGGTSYMHNGDLVAPKGTDYNILVVHDMVLLEKEWREQEEFSYADKYLENMDGWDIILCGHYHYRFFLENNGKFILNPGAMVRVKASLGDLNLVPSVYLNDGSNFELINLKSAKPILEVFAPKYQKEKKSVVKQELIEDFVRSLSEGVDGEEEDNLFDISSIIISKIKDFGCNEEVGRLVQYYIAKSEENNG